MIPARRGAARLLVALAVGVLVVLALLAPRPAAADDAATRAAKKHFQRGEKLFNLARFEEALVEYEAAYEKKPLPGFLYNIGQCHRNLGNYRQAIFSYRNYLRQVPEARNREAVLALIDELEGKQRALELRAARERAEREPPPPPPPPRRQASRPLYRRTWFLSAVGAVTILTVGSLVLAGGGADEPATDLGTIRFD